MPEPELSPLVHRLRRLVGDDDAATDRALLDRFTTAGDGDAFAALLARHTPLVWGVCRRVLRDTHAAEDAFQATFLVLARKATSLRSLSIAGWLYRVAFRIALAARAARPCPAPLSEPVADPGRTDPADTAATAEVVRVLDEEVQRLPEKYRLPVLLCFFGGRTHAEAAAELGWPVGTVAGRLARAKELLRARLNRRGFGLTATSLAALFVTRAAPAALAGATTRAALAFATTGQATTAVSQAAQGLATGWLRSQAGGRITLALALLLLTTAGLVLALPLSSPPSPPSPRVVSRTPIPPAPRPPIRPALLALPNRIVHSESAQQCAIRCLAVSPDGKTIATLGDAPDPTLRIWDARTGQQLAQIDGYWPGQLLFRPDGQSLAMRGPGVEGPNLNAPNPGRSLVILDLQTRREVASCKFPATQYPRNLSVTALAFTPDGQALIGGCLDGTVFLWHCQKGSNPVLLPGHQAPVTSIALSPDGQTLASGGAAADTTVRLWSVRTRQLLATLKGSDTDTYPGQDNRVFALNFQGDGATLIAADRQKIRYWDVASRREQHAIPLGPATPDAGEITPDGRLLLDSAGRIWDLATRQVRTTLPRGHIREAYFHLTADGTTVYSAGTEGIVKAWDVATGREYGALPMPHDAGDFPTDPVATLAISRDGKTMISTGGGPLIRVWDLDRGEQREAFPGLAEQVPCVALSPDGTTLAVGSGYKDGDAKGDGTIRFLDARTGAILQAHGGHRSEVVGLAFSPDGSLLAAFDRDGTFNLWEHRTGRARFTIDARGIGFTALAFNPDGATLAIGWGDQRIHLWDVRTGRETATLKGHVNLIRSLDFSPDGRLLASGGLDGLVKLWDVQAGRELATLEARTWAVHAVRFTPDGQTLIAGHDSGPATPYPWIKLWDVKTRRETKTLRGHAGAVNALAVSPDGTRLYSGGTDRAILIWDLTATK